MKRTGYRWAKIRGAYRLSRGRRLCPHRRAVDRAAVGNVKMWNCGSVKVWKYENGLGLRQIPPRGARGRGAESAALGQQASCPLGGDGLLGQRASCPLGKRSFSLQFQRAGRPLSQWVPATGGTPVVSVVHIYTSTRLFHAPFHLSTFPLFHSQRAGRPLSQSWGHE